MKQNSVWHSTQKPHRIDPRGDERRTNDDYNALIMVHKHIETSSNYAMNKVLNALLAGIHDARADMIFWERADTVRYLKDMAFNTSQKICVDGRAVNHAVDEAFPRVFHLPRQKRRDMCRMLKAYRNDYEREAAFPTLEQDHSHILAVTMEVFVALMDKMKGVGGFDSMHENMMFGVMRYFATTLHRLEQGEKVEDVLIAPEAGKNYCDNAYKNGGGIISLKCGGGKTVL